MNDRDHPLLELTDTTTGYGRVEILHSLSLAVGSGEVVAVLGPNGVGKTTLLKLVSGTLPMWSGRIRFDGRRIDGRTPYEIARRGILLVPEGRGIFPGLSVAENLEIGVRATKGRDAAWRRRRIEDVVDRFPRLGERMSQQAATLSGGEQQMLSLSRAFLSEPRLLLLDEISMGLAPIIVEQLFAAVADLKAEGQTIVLVEQYLTYALRHADRCYVLAKGRVSFEGSTSELESDEVLAGSYLGR